jgi:hypothetical protein
VQKNINRNYIILGMSFMLQRQVIFNLEQKRVGFVRANCSHDLNEVIRKPPNITIFKEKPKNSQASSSIKWTTISISILVSVVSIIVIVVLVIFCLKKLRRPALAQMDAKAIPEIVVVENARSPTITDKTSV